VITIHSAEQEYRLRRQELTGIVLRAPAESCVYVYAFNAEGALIQPWYQEGPHPPSACPYELFLFRQHYNERSALEVSVLTIDDPDAGDLIYDPNRPMRNPHHGIMLAARGEGQCSIKVHARLRAAIAKGLSEQDLLPQRGPEGPSASFTVHVVNGLDRLDTLELVASEGGTLFVGSTMRPTLRLEHGVTVQLRVTGVRYREVWDDAEKEKKYRRLRCTVSLNDVCWLSQPHEEPKFAGDALRLETTCANGTQVQVTGTCLDKTKVHSFLEIHVRGRMWKLDVEVYGCPNAEP
jgi:hypothetical protein